MTKRSIFASLLLLSSALVALGGLAQGTDSDPASEAPEPAAADEAGLAG